MLYLTSLLHDITSVWRASMRFSFHVKHTQRQSNSTLSQSCILCVCGTNLQEEPCPICVTL